MAPDRNDRIEDAVDTLRDAWGTGALPFASARRMECIFYQDQAGLRYWTSIERALANRKQANDSAANG